MIAATVSRAKKADVNRAKTRERQELKQRTQERLTQEIAFIPSPAFRELDYDRGWKDAIKKSLASDGYDATPLDVKVRMPAHLERLCSAPLLSPTEEREMFCRMNYLKYRANALRSSLNVARPSQKKLNDIDEHLEAANRVRNQIIHANVRLVISIVKQFADARNPFDDLLSEGISCLIKAVEKFDADRGFRFSTYATRAVRREVFRLVQRHHRDRTRFATGTAEVLQREMNTEDKPIKPERTWHQIDRSIQNMLAVLDQREQFIVGARYGFEDIGEKPTFQRLGELLGVSKERVRPLEQRALNKLRDVAHSIRLEPIA